MYIRFFADKTLYYSSANAAAAATGSLWLLQRGQ